MTKITIELESGEIVQLELEKFKITEGTDIISREEGFGAPVEYLVGYKRLITITGFMEAAEEKLHVLP